MVSSLHARICSLPGASFFLHTLVHSVGPVVMQKPKCGHLIAEGKRTKMNPTMEWQHTDLIIISSLPRKSHRIWESILGKLGYAFPWALAASISLHQIFQGQAYQNISKNSCILGEFSKKKKARQKNSYPTETLSISSSIIVFYPGCAARHL